MAPATPDASPAPSRNPFNGKSPAVSGVLIGAVNMAWLYLAYYLGLHTNGMGLFQLFMLGWFLLNAAAYILMLRAARRQRQPWGYLPGLGFGFMAALCSSLVAVVAQFGYWKVVHPGWPAYMAEAARDHYEKLGWPPEKVEEGVRMTQQMITLENYAMQSAFMAIVIGLLLSALVMVYLRTPPASATPTGRNAETP